jgi:hypothetical protein
MERPEDNYSRFTPESVGPNEKKMTRRGFLAGVGNAAVAAGVAKVAYDNWPSDEAPETAEDVYTPESVEQIERQAERFDGEAMGYVHQAQLRYDEVLFVDAANRPVGVPVAFDDFPDLTYTETVANDAGEEEEKVFALKPGRRNDAGLLEGGFVPTWLDRVEAAVQEMHPEQPIARSLHVTGDFEAAYELSDEPDLRAAIERGEITQYVDIVKYFAEKPTRGHEDLTRQEYVTHAVSFTEWNPETGDGVPPVVEAELRRVLPGLCAQESKFNAAVTSSVGAQGIFQFMPATWEQHGGSPDGYTSLTEQVAVAGRFLSDLYQDVQHYIGEAGMRTLEEHCGDRSLLERDVLVPLVLNAYNAGARRVGEGVKHFLETQDVASMPVGPDTFIVLADHMASTEAGVVAQYRTHAREYVPRVYAQAAVLARTN